MKRSMNSRIVHIVLFGIGLLGSVQADANASREKGKAAIVANSTMTITPPRDWNSLSAKPGKKAESWTLDGDLLNEVTFYGGIAAGEPLIRERSKKREPLPKLSQSALLAELPELLEATYRASKGIGSFTVTGSAAEPFLGQKGIRFTYEYVDRDELPRKGEAHATLIGGALYMATLDAPRLHYYEAALLEFQALVRSAKL